MNSVSNKVYVYSHLRHSEDTQSEENNSLYTRMDRLTSDAKARTAFFEVWWKKGLDEKDADRLAKSAGELSYYLERSRETARYILSEPEEKVIATLSPTGISSLVKLYSEITNGFEYKMNINGEDQTLTREQLAELVRQKDYALREKAYKTLYQKYGENLGVLGGIYQSRVLNWRDENVKMRKL